MKSQVVFGVQLQNYAKIWGDFRDGTVDRTSIGGHSKSAIQQRPSAERRARESSNARIR
jgi:hypothetical protein